MDRAAFDTFFSDTARRHLVRSIRDALQEDGPDLTSNAVFGAGDALTAAIVAKEETLLAGIHLAPMILEETAALEPGEWALSRKAGDGDRLHAGDVAAVIQGSARVILRAERVILNFITHLSGIANLVYMYAQAVKGTGVCLLDTRKTLPGLRYPEKYAVLVGGGSNHRKNLGELLMLKDNHIDAAGGIAPAVDRLRYAYDDRLPIEVECRTLQEVGEAVRCGVSRIMLDNMLETGGTALLNDALALVPPAIEAEISGGVTLDNIRQVAEAGGARKADFISVGRLTHAAPPADFSMRITL